MAAPVCPPGYVCKFTPIDPGFQGPWWEGPWGIAAAGAALLVLAILIGVTLTLRHDRAGARERNREREREATTKAQREREQRAHQIERDEQLTMQLDAAKGNPEVLRWLRDQRKIEG